MEDSTTAFTGQRADSLSCGLTAHCAVFISGRGKPPNGCPGRQNVSDRVVEQDITGFGAQQKITPVFTYDSCRKRII